jgi:hypothetical protein
MNLQQRIEILSTTGAYISAPAETADGQAWEHVIHKANQKNNWFTPEFCRLATQSIATKFLQKERLEAWAAHYHLNDSVLTKTVGIVMAGNIPLVGFHDFLCVFISGHKQVIKLSSKDDVLLKHLVEKMIEWEPEVAELVQFAERLNNCDAYIATGSDNSARYFEYYFGRYPSVIRKNRTSVAVLTGAETEAQLHSLADDIMLYFGLGCRNVTKIFVPLEYNFEPILKALKKYSDFFDHHKYRSNYDYQLAIYIMNNKYYMTNDCIVLVENDNPFSPIGTLHYSFYKNEDAVYELLKQNPGIQAIVGAKSLPFGSAQQPSLVDYADGADVMQFLLTL